MIDLIFAAAVCGAAIGGGAVALIAGAATQRLEGRNAALARALDKCALRFAQDAAEIDRLAQRLKNAHFRNPKTGRLGKRGQTFE